METARRETIYPQTLLTLFLAVAAMMAVSGCASVPDRNPVPEQYVESAEIFPPVFVDVQAGDEVYDEIHVDGGASSQVFFYPVSVDASRLAQDLGVQGTARIYLVRNAYLHPRWKAVEPTLARIAGRSLGSLIRNQGIGDVYRIYSAAERDGIDFNLAYIPDSFDVESEEEFDPAYMRALFDLGFRLARDGYPWSKAPVGHVTP